MCECVLFESERERERERGGERRERERERELGNWMKVKRKIDQNAYVDGEVREMGERKREMGGQNMCVCVCVSVCVYVCVCNKYIDR